MNLHRTFVIASNVFREVIRDRVLYLLGFFAALMVAATVLVPEVAASTGNEIILDLGLAAIGLLGLAITVFVGTGLVNKEIEKRTVYVMVAKPISPMEFIVGKHLGLSAVVALLVVTMSVIYLGILATKQITFPLDSILIAAGFQFLELSLIAAIAILFGVFTNSLLATLLTFATYLMGHLSQDLLTLSTIGENSGLKRTIEGLYLILPDLARLNLKNQAVYGMKVLPPASELLSNIAYAVVYIVLVLTIATLTFSRRQF